MNSTTQLNNSTHVNVTTTTSFRHDWFDGSWKVAQIVNIVLILATIVKFVTLYKFGSRSNNKLKWRKAKQGADRLILLALLIISMALLTLILAQVVLLVDKHPPLDNNCCEVVMDLCIGSFVFTHALVYVFLWYRMERIYNQALLRRFQTKIVKALSYTVLAMIIGATVLFTSALTYPNNHHVSNGRCEQEKIVHVTGYVANLMKSVSNCILFGLLYHPLRLHQARNSEGRTARRVVRTIRLAIGSVVACVVTDVTTTLVHAEFVPRYAAAHFINTVWDVNLFIHVATVVLGFDVFRKSSVRGQQSVMATEGRQAAEVVATNMNEVVTSSV